MSHRCAACGEPLGAYEPLVWVAADGPVHGGLLVLRETPGFEGDAATLLHAACHARGRKDS